MKKRLVTLVILDGFGINRQNDGNAVAAAHKPNLDSYFREYPNTIIHTSGMDVGLPRGQMGNSEVGHTNIGAGRIVYQELTRITKSIEDGDFFEKRELVDAMENCRRNGTKLHLYGLLSDGGVHSHNTHLYALIEMARKFGLKDVFVHCFFDGRDVPPDSAKGYVEELEAKLKEIGVGSIASVMGRYYAMDRDNRWERVKLAYDAMVLGQGLTAGSAGEAVAESYAREEFDEFVKPTVILKDGKPTATIGENDSIIFFNFRPDRAREITRAFVDPEFNGFERAKGFFPVHYVCMTQYDKTMPNVSVAFKPESLVNTFGEYISQKGLRQLRIAETEKYAHVTFFFNGGVETMYEGEDRCLIPSPKVPTYDMKPEMSAYEVTEEVLKRIDSRQYDVIILNFANCDMVGHTGVFEAAKAAVEAIDECVGRIVEAVRAQDGILLITADHGNAEQMLDYENGGPFTAHTTNVVPLIGIGIGDRKLKEGRLADLAPTMLELLGLEKPAEMTGESLLD
ncbi:MAG: 2,3-bisphosphoglycerate-independent phosphoglycerate mutase [Acetivibrionales bacterium]|jgi:2,3-bisphosphoglycerate-independent phosphoglycerate mutase|nr:2,3-bisphosphoglycerate-independent phosphoglycerate mutase [Bacillota bacterium]NLP07921.1 2,3-bisphosphoglycerate-independent phosphoglycerate mutase [Clostridiaceae bacterium]HOA55904.1 2,3-bisphosphoglycerate-independent phosphoglycerate mutase [Clostridiales bacterium]HQD30462.1 2,3-bisphosphoglycerate-independent phosphoglycerate mutase [Clostridiales bacterium]